MKVLISAFLLLSLASAGTFLSLHESVQSQQGHQCVPNPSFNVTSFDVSPWPPTTNISLTMTMNGTFTRNVTVQDLAVGTNFNRTQWHFHYTQINQNYTQGQNYSYVIQTGSGEQVGRYIKEVELSHEDRNGNYVQLACWQFEYALNGSSIVA